MAKYRFGDICEVLNGRAYKQNELLSSGRYPILRVGNFFSSDRWYYSDMELPENKYCDYEDLLFAWSASFGPKIWDGGKVIYHYHIWKLIPNDDVADKFYLYYWLQHSVNRLTAGTHGSVMAHMTKGDMENQSIELPSLQTQKKISSILRTIDEKIHNNEAINNNLEQQLHLLFIQIFNGISEDVVLGDVVETTSGGTPSRKHTEYYENSSICWVKSKELLGNYILDTEEHINDIALSKSSAKLLPVHSVLIAMYGATVGAYGIISKSMTCNQAVCALLCNEKYPYTYLFQIAQEQQQKLINMAVGSAQQNISQVLIKQLPLHSDIAAIRKFHNLALPLHKQIEKLQAENRTLSEMRDTLLPQLMSGKLDVSDIDL